MYLWLLTFMYVPKHAKQISFSHMKCIPMAQGYLGWTVWSDPSLTTFLYIILIKLWDFFFFLYSLPFFLDFLIVKVLRRGISGFEILESVN